MTMYNCKHDGDQYRITKFTSSGDVQSSYLCDHVTCQCPAGVRDTCRHRLMLPTFLEHGLVNTNLFLDWDNGRRIVDFNGLPATVRSNVDKTCDPTDHLAPQAHTDTCTQTEPAEGYRGFESKAAYEAHYSNPANYADEIESMAAYTRECEAERDATIQPANPNGWRRW